jgi:xylulokinase
MSWHERDLVIGIDSSTQSTKAIAWDRAGRLVAEGSAPIAMRRPAPGVFEQDPADWWASLGNALRVVLRTIDPGRIAALAIANQRETLAFLDAHGGSVRPAMVWLDERAREKLPGLAAALGAETIHRITGKPLDLTPALGRIAWLRDAEPETYRRIVCFADVQSYLVYRLTGSLRTSCASADPSGVFDIVAREWSERILDVLGLDAGRFVRTVEPGAHLGVVAHDAALVSGLPAGTPVIAGAGDGQCAGLATDCARPGRAYLNLGTAIVSGVWSPHYAYALDWRTLISASGDGYLLETVQRSGAFTINWFRGTFGFAAASATDLAELERGAAALSPGADGLVMLPYLSGCMNPHWDPDARGCFIGITGSHGTYHFYRAILEGLTLESARAAQAMQAAGVTIDEIVVNGGGAKSRLWLQIVADTTNRPVHVCETVEASALGAGILAAFGAGWFPDIRSAAAAMSGRTVTIEPNRANVERYRQLMTLHGAIYAANAPTFAALREFTLASIPSTPESAVSTT